MTQRIEMTTNIVPAASHAHLDFKSEPSQAMDVHHHIAAYDAANDAYGVVLHTVDPVEIGREPSEAEIAGRDAAEARFVAAEVAVCEYVPRTIEESRTKAAFLALRRERGHFDDDDAFAALLRSISRMVEFKPD